MTRTMTMAVSWGLITCLFLLLQRTLAEPKPKGSPDPWDWQSKTHYPKYTKYEQDLEILKKQPYFLKVNANVTVGVGETAYLPCRVKTLGEFTVSWIRGFDVRVLTVSHLTFSSDPRFSLVHVPRHRLSAEDWTLKLSDTRPRDEGVYECQINTEPKIHHKAYLVVQDLSHQKMQDDPHASRGSQEPAPAEEDDSNFLEENGPVSSISGAPVQYVSRGSTVGLECTISQMAQPPLSLYWKLDGAVVTAKDRPGISLESERVPGVSRARIFISNVREDDSGNYSCVSDIARPASVLVIVTKGGDGAALLTSFSSSSSLFTSSVMVLIFSSPAFLLIM